jgi:hypothetical protein
MPAKEWLRQTERARFPDRTGIGRIEKHDLGNPILQKVRDLFIFSFYTGLAYVDLMALQPANIISSVDGT